MAQKLLRHIVIIRLISDLCVIHMKRHRIKYAGKDQRNKDVKKAKGAVGTLQMAKRNIIGMVSGQGKGLGKRCVAEVAVRRKRRPATTPTHRRCNKGHERESQHRRGQAETRRDAVLVSCSKANGSWKCVQPPARFF